MTLLDSLFSLKIGLDRMKVQDRLRELVSPKEDSPERRCLDISADDWTYLQENFDPAGKEQLSLSSLVALAVLRTYASSKSQTR